MINKRAAIVVLSSITSISFTWWAVACEPETTGPADDPVASPVAPEELQLLKDIRGQIGSPLDASVFESTKSAASFDSVYAETAQDAPRRTSALARPSLNGELKRAEVPVLRSTYATSLRDAARALDVGAADLEDAGEYAQADALRAWAAKLRADARK